LLTFTFRLTQIAHKTAAWDKEKGFYQENMRQDLLNIDTQNFKKGSFCFREVQLLGEKVRKGAEQVLRIYFYCNFTL
jgi:hypothetical protein